MIAPSIFVQSLTKASNPTQEVDLNRANVTYPEVTP